MSLVYEPDWVSTHLLRVTRWDGRREEFEVMLTADGFAWTRREWDLHHHRPFFISRPAWQMTPWGSWAEMGVVFHLRDDARFLSVVDLRGPRVVEVTEAQVLALVREALVAEDPGAPCGPPPIHGGQLVSDRGGQSYSVEGKWVRNGDGQLTLESVSIVAPRKNKAR